MLWPLSSFYIGDTEYTVPMEMMDMCLDSDARDMNFKVGKVLTRGNSFRHLYDFGTSTELKLRVVDERQGNIGAAQLRRLSQNEGARVGLRSLWGHCHLGLHPVHAEDRESILL
jgi:hypothetical protein